VRYLAIIIIIRGNLVMTAVLAFCVIPGVGLEPYIIMGADSLSVGLNSVEDTRTRNEGVEKIFKINDKLISISGKLGNSFIPDLLSLISESELNFDELTTECFDYAKKYISDCDANDARCGICIGNCLDSNPTIVFIEVKKQSIEESKFEIHKPRNFNIPNFSGTFMGSFTFPADDDLIEEFKQRIRSNCPNINVTCFKSAAKDLLQKMAIRYPETCNEDINFMMMRR
jgi:hypothetical protein